jgi:VanZ family protein
MAAGRLALGRILLIVILLVAYGSLYPFDFHSQDLPASPLWILVNSWPPHMDRSTWVDVILNVLLYIPVGLFGSLSLGKSWSILLAAMLSAGIEMLQLFDVSRTCSVLDLVSNTAGGAAGVWLAQAYGKGVTRLLGDARARASLRPSPALLLLGSWIGYEIFPLIPFLRLSPIRMKVFALLHPAPFSLLQASSSAFEWLAVARLLREVRLGAGTLPLLMLLIPGKLFLASRSFTWPELAGAIAAWIFWNSRLFEDEKGTRLLAWFGAAVLLLRGLAPFHWQSAPGPFSWKPFAGFFEAAKDSAVLVFFEKTFLYGTAVWLFSQCGYSIVAAALGVAGMLGVIELAQTHLPGRTAEITDPLYTLLLAAILRMLDTADRTRRTSRG